MGWEQLGSGSVFSSAEIVSLAHNDTNPGERVMLSLDVRVSPAASLLNAIQSAMNQAGVQDAQVTSGSPVINVIWRNPPLIAGIAQEPISDTTLIIIAIIIALVAVSLIIGWRFFHEVAVTAGPVATTLLVIGGAILAAAIGYSLLRRKY